MRIWLAAGLAVMLATTAGFAGYQKVRADRQEARAVEAEGRAASLLLSIEIRRRQDEARRIIEEEARGIDQEFQDAEGADAGLSDYMRGAAVRMWGK